MRPSTLLLEQPFDDFHKRVRIDRQMNCAKSKVDSVISDASDQGREAIDAVRDVADTVGEAIEDSLERRPYATLAMVAGIGFLLGAAWRR